jgi:predicted phage baseplate assembly protein
MTSSRQHPNNCDCCEGTGIYTPVKVENRPGLAAVSRRVGTHGRFKATMLARLSDAGLPALAGLTTREDDDFTIALIDAWATVADVLTFYQERYNNESYLRTAGERFSLLHLARMIGYEPRPGLAARAYLAFTVEDAPGSPAVTTVEAGTKIQSIPNPGEMPQTFETMATVEARAKWNAMKPLTMQPQAPSTSMSQAIVEGIDLRLKAGDSVLIVDEGDNRMVKRVMRVVPDPEAGTTRVEFDAIPQPPPEPAEPGKPSDLDYGIRPVLTGKTLDLLVLEAVLDSQDDLFSYAGFQNWSKKRMVSAVNNTLASQAEPQDTGAAPDTGLFALRQRAAVFGHNAPDYDSLPTPPPNTTSWEGRTLGNDSGDYPRIDLATTYPEIIPGSWIVLENIDDETDELRVDASAEISRADYSLSGRVTRLTLRAEDGDIAAILTTLYKYKIRETTVLAQSEPLPLAQIPDTTPVEKNVIQLDRLYENLSAGQFVIVSGVSDDLPGVTVHDVATVKQVSVVEGCTRLEFLNDLSNRYVRDTVTVNANVVLATHGETQPDEALGSGDASQPYQTFALRQKPLTFVPADTETGAATTLAVRVDRVLWQEVDTLYGHGPDDRVYVTQIAEDGTVTVKFGDGRTGRRLPTGQENVVATYRKGIGLEGLVDADQLSLLLTRPHGVRSVANPLAAFGADDPEPPDDIRDNATLGIRTLRRVVSLQDYQDFARAYTGIAKALATWTWDGQRRGIFITVAGPEGAEVQSEDLARLVTTIKEVSDPLVPVTTQSYTSRTFQLDADVKIDSDYLDEDVLAAVDAALRAAFAFEARGFGQPVHASEVIALIQAVAGVIAVDLNTLFVTGEPELPNPRLPAPIPRPGTMAVDPAVLLTLDPRPISLGVMV